ncbi:hypothetical protein FZEAL_2526 [Fusarium zealandicum]|uniref:Pectate lyase n=1 Tax=Fusarium zealandicum TaxID=1053134 RepID=A0A8H4XMP5_9HYPO|nr:hypothetical protein FZEAL_2526 [Fusarium zealandicum]
MAASMALGNVANAMPAPPQVTSAPDFSLAKRQQPAGGASSVLKAPMTIAAGETFDGKDAIFDRGVDCTGQAEGGDSDAVFILEAGASLSNVVIGPNQIEGVHCNGGCTITNVWWDAVCEDAFSIKKQADGETTTINGGGAKGAEDKVIQHNGGGTVVIKDFTVSDFGKLYRSCGNCDEMPARHVEVSGVTASDGSMLVGINPNMGDTATITDVTLTNVKSECITFKGVTDGGEPEEVGTCDGAGGAGAGGASDAAPTDGATPTSASPDAPATSAVEESEATPSAVDESNSGDEKKEESGDEKKEESGDEKKEESDEKKEESSDEADAE